MNPIERTAITAKLSAETSITASPSSQGNWADIAVDDEVGRDSRLAGWLLWVLIAMTAIGVVFMSAIASAVGSLHDTPGKVAAAFLAVCVFGLAVTAIVFANRGDPTTRTVGSVFLWGFAVIGGVGILATIMAALMVVALIIYLFVVCIQVLDAVTPKPSKASINKDHSSCPSATTHSSAPRAACVLTAGASSMRRSSSAISASTSASSARSMGRLRISSAPM
jgi:hypothetical protein